MVSVKNMSTVVVNVRHHVLGCGKTVQIETKRRRDVGGGPVGRGLVHSDPRQSSEEHHSPDTEWHELGFPSLCGKLLDGYLVHGFEAFAVGIRKVKHVGVKDSSSWAVVKGGGSVPGP